MRFERPAILRPIRNLLLAQLGLSVLTIGGLVALVSCTTAGTTAALATPAGQLFCAITTAGGATTIAGIIDAAATAAAPGLAPVAVLATNATAAVVQGDCAAAALATGAKAGFPVSPPPSPATAPTIAIVKPSA